MHTAVIKDQIKNWAREELETHLDKEFKMKFVNTSDFMIHGRARGETFGLAIAEFSIRNKPIIAFSNPPEKAHLEILGEKCLIYKDKFNCKLLSESKNKMTKIGIFKVQIGLF